MQRPTDQEAVAHFPRRSVHDDTPVRFRHTPAVQLDATGSLTPSDRTAYRTACLKPSSERKFRPDGVLFLVDQPRR